MSDNEKLLPCPFCGGKAHVVRHNTGENFRWYGLNTTDTSDLYGVECERCPGSVVPMRLNENEAVEAWNNRFWGKEIMLMGDRLYFQGLGTFERVKDEH